MRLEQQDDLTIEELVLLLRGLASQLEGKHGLSVQGRDIPVAEQVLLRFGFAREGGRVSFELGLQWPDPEVAVAATFAPGAGKSAGGAGVGEPAE